MSNPTIETELSDGTITLRRPTDADTPTLIDSRDDLSVRFLGTSSQNPSPTAVVLDSDRQIVGWVDYDTERDWLAADEANIGYATFPDHRGKGFASRAVLLLVSFLAQESVLMTASLLIDPNNIASVAVAQRAGFVQHGEIDGQLLFKRELR